MPEVLDFAYEHSMFRAGRHGPRPGRRANAIPEEFLTPMTNLSARLKAMDDMGVDIQVVSLSILQQCTDFADPDGALQMERLGNERIAELVVARQPDRLVGLSCPCRLPRWRPARSSAAWRAGFKGVIVSSHVNGIESSATRDFARSGRRRKRSAPRC